MKFSLFAHIERYDDSVSHKQLLDELTEFTLMAEAGGMETIWIGEHHAMEYTVAPNPFINLAYLAAKTTKIRLGTGNVIAPFWHPIRLAGEAALCDLTSNGRLDLGIARGAYEASLKYSKEREQFGQAIGQFQAIGFKLTDMATEVRAAELLTFQAAYRKNNNLLLSKEGAFAKYYASEVAVKCGNEAVQIMGAYGYTKEYPAEKFLRDAKLMTIGEGTSEIQKIVISREILK